MFEKTNSQSSRNFLYFHSKDQAIMSGDDRFSSMHNSATFKSSKKDNFKVKVDDRFKTLLSDERFQSVPGQVDRYGRKTKSKDSANKVAKEMREFYDIDEGEEAVPEPAKKSVKSAAKPNGGMDRLDYLNKLSRGEISDEGSSDSDSSGDSDSDSGSDSDESGSDEGNITRKKSGTTYDDPSHKSALQVPGQEEQELVDDVVSTRIAIQNSDWENVSAEDLMVVLQSFCPAGGTSAVRKVTVYVSDFGKKRMELESRYGPQGIWKIQEEDDEDENNEDLYDQIIGVDEAEMEEEEEEEEQEGSGSDASGSQSEDSESEQEKPSKSKNNHATSKAPLSRKATKAAKKGDFLRKNGAVGLVMHHDLKLRGVSSKYKSGESDDEQSESEGDSEEQSDSGSDEESGSDNEDEEGRGGGKPRRKQSAQSKKAVKKQLKDGEGFDEVALRKYELSKLRYYFAVAECDSARTANMLYEELDGVEMESSAMVFDLSLVPEELSFEGREVRDSFSASASGAVNPNYKPPDFVVNALQHTKVQCSWDEGEKLRDRQLSNFSTWRNLNESELQQYVADSDSSDEEEEEDDSEPEKSKKNGKSKKISKKKQSKAAMMRKMLLGGGSDESEADDFFAEEEEEDGSGSDKSDASAGSGDEQDSMYGGDDVPEGFSRSDIGSDDDDDEEGGEGKSMTYMPDLGKDILARKRGVEETPYEAEQRKMAEKKKARKAAKKAYQEAQEAEKKALALGQAGGKKAKGSKAAAPVVLTEEERRKQAALELLFDEDAKDDYDMREVVKAEKDKARGKKSNKRKKAKLVDGENGAEGGDNFKIDTADDRFSKLFEGDSRFGIDKTSTEFRPTPAVKEILSEQTKRRAQKEKNEFSAPASSKPAPKADEPASVDVNNLVNKLKRKYAKA